MKKIFIKKILFSLAVFLCSFVIIATIFFTSSIVISAGSINFQSKDGGFRYTCIPFKGRDYQAMERRFESYKEEHNISDGGKLYRVTSVNYFNISKWCQYKYGPEWNYPYLWVWNR